MWKVRDIYPSRTEPGKIAVDFWSNEEPLNCRRVTKVYRDSDEARRMIPTELEWLQSGTDAKKRIGPDCERLRAEFGLIPAEEQEAAAVE